jgi:hypothetical protein
MQVPGTGEADPAENARYVRAGFEAIGSFEGYVAGSVITTT